MSLPVFTCHCGRRHYGRLALDPQQDSECASCFDVRQPGELLSEDIIRCPECGDVERDLWEYAWNDGEHPVICGKCHHEYTVGVETSITYTSPARLDK